MERELRRQNKLLLTTIDELHGLHEAFNRGSHRSSKNCSRVSRPRPPSIIRAIRNQPAAATLRPRWRRPGRLFPYIGNSGRLLRTRCLRSRHCIGNDDCASRGLSVGSSPEQNIALIPSGDGRFTARNPAELAQILNKIVLSDMQTENYFTFVYANIDVQSAK